jgi:hypothetical protein
MELPLNGFSGFISATKTPKHQISQKKDHPQFDLRGMWSIDNYAIRHSALSIFV